ncbi:unnamed protein product, partial [Thlaspi arvense]
MRYYVKSNHEVWLDGNDCDYMDCDSSGGDCGSETPESSGGNCDASYNDLVSDDDRCFNAECDEHGGSDSDESLSDEGVDDDSAADNATTEGFLSGGDVSASETPSIAVSRSDWYYISCNRCDKKVEPCEDVSGYDGHPLFDCLECKKDVSDVAARYRIIVHVSDLNGDKARFMLFDSVAEIVLGISAPD